MSRFISHGTLVAIAMTLFVCMTGAGAAFADSGEDVTYYDDENGFALTYQNGWSRVSSTHERMRIKIASENGNGLQDCAVYVRSSKAPKVFLRLATNVKALEKGFRKTLPDAKIVERGTTSLCDQSAVYYIMDFTSGNNGMAMPVRTYTVHAAAGNTIYTITCRAQKDRFDESMPDFKRILSGFVIDRD